VTDFGQSDDGLLFLVMELLDGESLGTLARRGSLPAARAASIGLAVAEALGHAHEAGIIHRDLKPDNVFVARRSRGREIVKVLDFGLAKLASDSALGPSITRDGTVFGTPEYMAPEQAEGEKLDGRTDIYALGVILYQLVTGQVPFHAGSFVALLTKQVTEAPLPPRERRPDLDIPPGLEQIILRCLAKRPLRGEVLRRPHGRLALGLGGAAIVAAAGFFTWLSLRGQPPAVSLHADVAEPPLARAARLIETGDVDGAERLLESLRQSGDTIEVEEGLSAAAERRGNRLRALAHLHRATRIQPRNPEPRARLAALLLRLGQPSEACRQARVAMANAPPEKTATAAKTVLERARCKEAP
jgi:serine/threonine protein kinase